MQATLSRRRKPPLVAPVPERRARMPSRLSAPRSPAMAVLRERPYCRFNFLVDLGDGVPEGPTAGFQEVGAIAAELGVTEYRNGNAKENNVVKLTGLGKYPNVTLKRGVI